MSKYRPSQEVAERINVLVQKRQDGTTTYFERQELSKLISARIRHVQGTVKVPDGVFMIDREDMFSVAVLAAYRQMGRWDRSGADFMTFAFGRIRGAMIDYLREVDKLPRSMRVQLAKINAAMRKIEQRNGTAYLEDVSRETEIPVDQIRYIMKASENRFTLSMHASVNGSHDDNATILGTIPVDDEKMRLLAKDLNVALRKLSERDERIMRDFYLRDMSQRDIATRNGLTEARISQIRQACLERLKSDLQPRLDRFSDA